MIALTGDMIDGRNPESLIPLYAARRSPQQRAQYEGLTSPS